MSSSHEHESDDDTETDTASDDRSALHPSPVTRGPATRRERLSGRPTVVPTSPTSDAGEDESRPSQIPTIEPPEDNVPPNPSPGLSLWPPGESQAALGFVDAHNRSSAPPSLPPPSDSVHDRPTCSGLSLQDLFDVGNFSGALLEAERRLARDPDDEEAMRYADECRRTLTGMYVARIGSLDRAVELRIPMDQIRWLSLDHHAGFMLSLVDGATTVDELLDMCAMPRLEGLRILLELHDRDVVAFA